MFSEDLPLRWGTAVVVQGRVGCCTVDLVIDEVGGQLVVRSVKLGTSRLVVSRVGHVGDFHGDGVHPVLPQVPIGLVHGAEITTLRSTLVGDLALREGSVVVRVVTRWDGREGAVVAVLGIRSGQNAWKNALEPIISV